MMAVFLGFGFVSVQSQGCFESAPSPSPRQKCEPHGPKNPRSERRHYFFKRSKPRPRSFRQWQREGKNRAPAGFVAGRNPSAVVFDNFFADGKAQAAAVGFAVGGKGLK